MISNRTFFAVGFLDLPTPVVDVWDTLMSNLRANRCLPKTFRLSQIVGHPEDLKSGSDLKLDHVEVRQIIIDRNLRGFWANSGLRGSELSLRLVGGRSFDERFSIRVHIDPKAKSPNIWNPLIEGILVQWPGIGGWQWNHLYHIWQTHCISGLYDRFFGEIPPGTKRYIKPSDDGISLDREMIDISLNPGRKRSLLPAIDFQPTAEMWLGPHFWQFAKSSKEEVLAADFFLEVRDTPHFLYLKSWPHPFTRPDGEQGRVQQKLWRLLFHEDCEWPPGSGGISDEAVYGPPELMPKDSTTS